MTEQEADRVLQVKFYAREIYDAAMVAYYTDSEYHKRRLAQALTDLDNYKQELTQQENNNETN